MYVHTFVGLLDESNTRNAGLVRRFPDLFKVQYKML